MFTLFYLFLMLFIVSSVFWLWMFIDCLISDKKDKLIWIALFLFLHFIAAVIYFFMAYNNDREISDQLSGERYDTSREKEFD